MTMMAPRVERTFFTHLLAFRGATRQNASCLHLANGARHSTARALATQPATRAGRNYDRRLGSRFHDDESSHQASQTSIYPASRAAQRLRPNAPQLFQHSARRGLGQDDDQAKQSQRRTTSDSYILRNVSTDPELKHLYTQLARAAESKDAVHAAKLALLIKRRKEELCAPSGQVEFDPSERIVFLAIMRALAPHGLLQEVQAVSDDMRSFGFSECIDSLNHLLEAAVISARREAIDDILDRIRNLPPPASAPQAERSSKLANLLFNAKPDMSRPGQTTAMEMPLDYMQNWNATTFAHLLESACQDHNLEMASLMLSSCYRLGFTLPHRALTHTITLFLHSEEHRAAVELADLMEQGGLVHRHDVTRSAEKSASRITNPPGSGTSPGQVARRFPPSIWMSILRACAEGGYLPGVELAWSKAVVQGLQTPDDGLLQLILALSAKEGCVQMARNCLAHIDPSYAQPSSSPTEASSSQRPSSGLDLQEWHLAPLFEAQCSARDYEGAMNTLSGLFRRGFAITNRSTSRISTSIFPHKSALQLAVQALTKTAADKAIGTHIDIVNAVISAAVWLGDLAQALEIYRALPTYQVIPRDPANVKGGNRSPNKITPTRDTFNVLLSGCIDIADYETGVVMLKDLNALKLKPNEVTFERMIMLCLTQKNYEDAFGFIEEAKERDIVPSRKSYEALARKCFAQDDHRWELVLSNMSDQGYRPSSALLCEFDLEPDAFRPKSRNRFAGRSHQD